MKLAPTILFLLAAGQLSIPLRAQSIYVDCVTGFGPSTPPSSSYGGPYGVPGTWNTLPLLDGAYSFVDSQGASTGITTWVWRGCDSNSCDAPELTGDDAALLESWWNGDCYASPNEVVMTGFAAGRYQLLLIGYGACETAVSANVKVFVNGNQVAQLQSGGVSFPGHWTDFPLGLFSLELTPTTQLRFLAFSTGYPGGLTGYQLIRLGDDSTPFCFGHLGHCPCAPGAPGRGCPSTFAASGALLAGAGEARMDADTLSLTANDVGNGVVTFLQGDNPLAHGFGVVFGDGLRCAGGQVVRLASKLASGGVVSYPGPGDPPISVKGLLPPSGGLRAYQAWYRNPQSFCTEATFNFSNAVAVRWR